MKFKGNFIKLFFFTFFITFICLLIPNKPVEAANAKAKFCMKPKSVGNCKEKIQRYYYDPVWMMCLAFVYTGCGENENSFKTKSECEHSCLPLDGSTCLGPNGAKPIVKPGPDCNTIVCPTGYKCARGAFHFECCHESDYNNINQAYDAKCPDGTDSGGTFNLYFQPIIGKTCDDLICEEGKKCVQINKDFAKCCGKTKSASPKN